VSLRVGTNHALKNIKNQIFYLNQIFLFFQKNHIFAIFRLYYAVKHQCIDKIVENISSIVSCTLHRIKVPEPVTVKLVVEDLDKLKEE